MEGAFGRALRGQTARWDGAEWARQPVSPRIAVILRWTLLAAAIATPIIMATIRPFSVSAPTQIANRPMPDQLVMTAPSLSGQLADGRRYQIVASTAAMAGPDASAITMRMVRAAIELEGGGRLDISADSGIFDRNQNSAAFAGNVVANRSDGYEVRSDHAEIWEEDGQPTARTTSQTHISGPEGTAVSTALTARPGFGSIRLIGPVRIRLNGGAR